MRSRHRKPRRRRGMVYLYVLSTSMLITVIGLSAIAVTRARLWATDNASDRIEARLYAQSAVEAALLEMYTSTNWRSVVNHDTWSPNVPIGRGFMAWKVADETRGSLTADRNAPVRVYSRGTCGDAVWVYSTLVQPPLEAAPTPTNLLINGNVEAGTTGWFGVQCTLAPDTTQAHEGATSLRVVLRQMNSAGPEQTVTNAVSNGTTYDISFWIRMDNAPEIVTIELKCETTAGVFQSKFEATAGTNWTQISGQLTPNWDSGATLTKGKFRIYTNTSTQGFRLDDAWMTTAEDALVIGTIPGTWRREAQ